MVYFDTIEETERGKKKHIGELLREGLIGGGIAYGMYKLFQILFKKGEKVKKNVNFDFICPNCQKEQGIKMSVCIFHGFQETHETHETSIVISS